MGRVACSRLQHLLETSMNPAPACVFLPRFIFISSTLLKISLEPVLECWELIPSQRISKKCDPVITLFPLYFLSNLTWTSFEKCPLWKLTGQTSIFLVKCFLSPSSLNLLLDNFTQVPNVYWLLSASALSRPPHFPHLCLFALWFTEFNQGCLWSGFGAFRGNLVQSESTWLTP